MNTSLFEDEAAVLRQLLGQLLAAPSAQSLEQLLPADQHDAARAAYFLFDVDDAGDVDSLVARTLDRLLQQFSHHTQQVPVEQRERVRGRINWPATYEARYSQHFDSTRFVCREVRHQYDTPENQLLKYLLDRIEHCLDAVPDALRLGACYRPGDLDRPPVAIGIWIGQVRTTLMQLRRNVRLRSVTLPAAIDEAHLRSAQLARVEEYAAVAHLYDRYRAIVLSASLDVLQPIGKRVLLMPDRVGDGREIWVRFGAALYRRSA